MNKENGNENKLEIPINVKFLQSTIPFSVFPKIQQKEKKDTNEIKIEDILENDDYFNDLKLNPNSP